MQNKKTSAYREIDIYKRLLTSQLSDAIQKKIKINWKLGRIFNHIQKMSTFKDMTTLGIFRSILLGLKKFNKQPSREQIKHHFRTKVSKDDYIEEEKREILSDLYNLT